MAISSEDALKMVDEAMGSEASQTNAPDVTETASAETTPADVKSSDVVDTEAMDEAASETADTKAKDGNGSAKGKEPSPSVGKSKKAHQQRVDYSFKKLKDDLKAKDKRIAELEAKLGKTTELTEEDFGGDKAAFQQHLVDQTLDKRELEEAKRWKEGAEGEVAFGEFKNTLMTKADECFGDDEEQSARFERLINNGFEKFCVCVNSHDPDGIIYEFLDDCKIAPKVLDTLMTKPDILRNVLDKKSALAKLRELQVLESNISIRSRVSKVKAKNDKPLPKLGSMVKSVPNGEPDNYDDAWGAAYLKAHKGGRF